MSDKERRTELIWAQDTLMYVNPILVGLFMIHNFTNHDKPRRYISISLEFYKIALSRVLCMKGKGVTLK